MTQLNTVTPVTLSDGRIELPVKTFIAQLRAHIAGLEGAQADLIEVTSRTMANLVIENAELRKRCEAYEMLNLGLQEMLDAKACPDCHKQNS
jgi:Zn finger protein HypA/HybF involved in hydrogenase expression